MQLKSNFTTLMSILHTKAARPGSKTIFLLNRFHFRTSFSYEPVSFTNRFFETDLIHEPVYWDRFETETVFNKKTVPGLVLLEKLLIYPNFVSFIDIF